MKLTQFDRDLYDTICKVEYDNKAPLIYCDETTGLNYLPMHCLFFTLPKKYWKQNIEEKTDKSLSKLESLGLVQCKELFGERLWRFTNPSEIVAFKLKQPKKRAKHIRNRKRGLSNKD